MCGATDGVRQDVVKVKDSRSGEVDQMGVERNDDEL